METAKQIADLYFPDNKRLANDLERDILNHVEHHLKQYEQKTVSSVVGCIHQWNFTTTTSGYCIKCGLIFGHNPS